MSLRELAHFGKIYRLALVLDVSACMPRAVVARPSVRTEGAFRDLIQVLNIHIDYVAPVQSHRVKRCKIGHMPLETGFEHINRAGLQVSWQLPLPQTGVYTAILSDCNQRVGPDFQPR